MTMAKTIFITGAGAGIGRGAARRFAAQGWRVAATDKDSAALDSLRGEIGPGHFFAALDVADATSVASAVSAFAADCGGRLDVLLNNAGIGVLEHFEQTPLSRLHATVDVNIKGVINCCRAAFPYLQAAGCAKVINMSSLASEYGVPSEAVYSASKFFVRGLTEALNIEWERHGIHVSDVMPNFVRTPMMEGVSGKLIDSLGIHLTVDDVVAAIWASVHDRRRVHRIVDSPRTTLLRLLARLAPSGFRRQVLKDLAGY
jgi:NAD(P)-dependent dehydrogenase (short-subunit alcohol dehydrogenase family)